MKVLGVIPARGGSKGVPRKNLRMLCGKPLLAWTAEVALASPCLDKVILSTDDEEIAELGRQLGLEVPFLRPAELATDEALAIDVIRHAVGFCEREGSKFDAVFTLQPTNPMRTAIDITGAVALLERTGADSVISFVDAGDKHPARMKQIDGEMRVIDPLFAEAVEGMPRQLLPKYYLREGSIYLTRRDVVVQQRSFKGSDCRAWLIPAERAVNLDTELDFALAELLLNRRLSSHETAIGD
ncbi:MAG: acylneuraminate cytidylyltransferase family protein [Bryobacteraceae bacterium]|nr:acylneuraminate cytidylyltransferase family protein [Bryobacteraceae bacterium]